MGWNKIESIPVKGQQKVVIKLPNNTIMRAMFTDGELSVYDQINDCYINWDELERSIEWMPTPE